MGVEAFSERHDPLCAAAAAIGSALEQWTRTHGRDRITGDAALGAGWPAGPTLPETPLTLVQLWETRLGADYLAIAVIDEMPPEMGEEEGRTHLAPVRAVHDVVFASLLKAGFDDCDL